jgi:hypothetical protein
MVGASTEDAIALGGNPFRSWTTITSGFNYRLAAVGPYDEITNHHNFGGCGAYGTLLLDQFPRAVGIVALSASTTIRGSRWPSGVLEACPSWQPFFHHS